MSPVKFNKMTHVKRLARACHLAGAQPAREAGLVRVLEALVPAGRV